MLANSRIKELLDIELLDVFMNADFIIANLECPLIDKNTTYTPIPKTGPVLGVFNDVIKGIKDLRINAFNLANNHIKDYGDPGVIDTINLLRANAIQYVGIGLRDVERIKPISITLSYNYKIGICSFADKEFSYSRDKGYSVSILDCDAPLYIQKLKREFDFLICFLHRGHYLYPYPSPRNYKLAHTLVESGADLVIFQHSHVVGAIEDFNNGKIFYGQGNFLFDYGDKVPEAWNYGIVILLRFHYDKEKLVNKVKIEFLPIKQMPSEKKIIRLKGSEEKLFYKNLRIFSEKMKKGEEEVRKLWEDYVKTQMNDFLVLWLFGRSRILRFFDRKIPVLKYIYPRKKRLLHFNIVRSEDNSELLESILEQLV